MRLIILILLLSNTAMAESIPEKIVRIAIQHGVDPQLALAVARTESALNPKARGAAGEIGLFQVMPSNYAKILLYDVDNNIRAGILLLKDYEKQCSDMGQYWVICYNQGPRRRPKYPQLHPYYKKVMRNKGLDNGEPVSFLATSR